MRPPAPVEPPKRIDWSLPGAGLQAIAAREYAAQQAARQQAEAAMLRQREDHARNRGRIEESFCDRRAELESRFVALAECVAAAPHAPTAWVAVRCHAGTAEETAAVVAVDLEAGIATLLRGGMAAPPSSPGAGWGLVPAPDEGALYLSSGGVLHVIPLRDGHAAAAGSRAWPDDWVESFGSLSVGGCSADGTKVYLYGPRGLLIADVSVGLTEIARWSVDEIGASHAITKPLAVSRDGSKIYAAAESTGSAARLLAFDLDPGSLEPQLVAHADIGSRVLALALRPGDDKLFVALDVAPPVVRVVEAETLAGGDVSWGADGYRARGFAPSPVARDTFYSTSGGEVTKTVIEGL